MTTCSQMYRTRYCHTRSLRRILQYLHLYVAKTIATVIVTIKIDYCNSVIQNIALMDINAFRIA